MTPLFERLAAATRGRVAGPEAKGERMRFLLAELGPLGADTVVVKLTGTNGKGSVSALLGACLRRAGLAVGTFTGPHLARPTERFAWNGDEATEEAMAPHVAWVLDLIERLPPASRAALCPSFFEALLLAGLRFFRERGARVMLLEGGIGGASDAVSHVPGPLTVLTTVAMDHVELLGPTLADIARDKVGMASVGSHLVLGPGVPASLEPVIAEEAARRALRPTWERGQGVRLVARGLAPWEARLARGGLARVLPFPLRGRHQEHNLGASLAALEALRELGVPSELAGLSDARWPGRLEVFTGGPTVVLDVAHNAEAIAALAATLDELAPRAARVLLYGASADKDYGACLPHLAALAPEVHLVDGFHRAESAEALARRWGGEPAGTWSSPLEALTSLRARLQGSARVLLVTGSLYLVGALRGVIAGEGC